MLELDCVPDVNMYVITAIAEHCCALRRLHIWFESLSASMRPIWESLVDPLRQIDIGDFSQDLPVAALPTNAALTFTCRFLAFVSAVS